MGQTLLKLLKLLGTHKNPRTDLLTLRISKIHTQITGGVCILTHQMHIYLIHNYCKIIKYILTLLFGFKTELNLNDDFKNLQNHNTHLIVLY